MKSAANTSFLLAGEAEEVNHRVPPPSLNINECLLHFRCCRGRLMTANPNRCRSRNESLRVVERGVPTEPLSHIRRGTYTYTVLDNPQCVIQVLAATIYFVIVCRLTSRFRAVKIWSWRYGFLVLTVDCWISHMKQNYQL